MTQAGSDAHGPRVPGGVHVQVGAVGAPTVARNGGVGRLYRYSIRSPEMARPITSCWICSVPSKMSKIFESRCQRSTGYSRV